MGVSMLCVVLVVFVTSGYAVEPEVEATLVRLVDGEASNEGRVEVNVNGEWGTVCDDGWDLNDANVVCRMLGFEGAIEAITRATFGQGTVDIFLDDVDCTGNENSILDCQYNSFENCAHFEDAGVICNSGVIRLVNGKDETEGRVEVNVNGEWGTVCHDRWDLNDAHVVCRMLGFGGAVEATRRASFGQGTAPILLDNVVCRGHEHSILDCKYKSIDNCDHSEDAGVVCNSGEKSIIRLVNGRDETEGRVELKVNGKWGTVCHDRWDLNDAHVVCRMLGFEDALQATRSSSFGQGTGKFLLDEVACTGNEHSLLDCQYNSIITYCYHSTSDAGVICNSGGTSVIRLVNGMDEREGRVEVKVNGQWGTVCDDAWGLNDANVVCRMLGFDGAVQATSSARFGWGTGPIHLDEVGCTGNENSILDCHYHSDANCGHSEDAGVICSSRDASIIRLVNGEDETEGRVELKVNGEWGTVCDDGWDLNDANVVCRMLGFEGAVEATTRASFGEGTVPILLDDVECTGHEHSLLNCQYDSNDNCTHTEDAGVICNSEETSIIRLVNGKDNTEGRVEVKVNGEWGTVCDDGWDLNDANVVCRMLGFEGAAAVTTRPAAFGYGTVDILLDDVNCTGNENSILECQYNSIDNCYHSKDAGVICNWAGTTLIRLEGGEGNNEGRVEVRVNGRWGTVCDDGWDINDAHVVCRMFGFEGAVDATSYATFGEGRGEILLYDVACTGNENSLLDCPYPRRSSKINRHSEDAGVICNDGGSSIIRLVSGEDETEGRVEVNVNGQWGTVCDDEWDLNDANVVCRMLGFEGAVEATSGVTFGYGHLDIILDDVACTGNEDSVLDCQYNSIHNCTNSEKAGVICNSGDASVIRLVNGENETEGRVEMKVNGEWGTVCDDGWDLNDANVVCRMLGFEGAVEATTRASFGQGTAPILLDDVECTGYEHGILDCQYSSIDNCAHSEDAGVICYSGETPIIRLVNGEDTTEGRVEVNVNGKWGTVCDDGWDLNDANVVCRMLGFEGAVEATRRSSFGEGTGDILLDEVACTGNEDSILDCQYNSIVRYCYHFTDAGVICAVSRK